MPHGTLRRNELKQRFGITRAFLATHSGLTRWMDFTSDSDDDFIATNKRSVDEIWYKRAVEQHFVEPQSFVFSVPFNTGNKVHCFGLLDVIFTLFRILQMIPT